MAQKVNLRTDIDEILDLDVMNGSGLEGVASVSSGTNIANSPIHSTRVGFGVNGDIGTGVVANIAARGAIDNTNNQNSKEWKPAIYARLSNEDVEQRRSNLSLSIENQLDILRNFVADKGWQPPKVFYDDDRTGTNFDRKGFQDMYAEAKAGNINVIVIKDTSRFGRNWVKSGIYFESIEEMGIRFISIQESLDTADPQCPALKMLPFYFIFNEWHSQTTSEKIKTVFAKIASQGGFIGSFAPYGYVRSDENKQKLVVDPVAASVVKRIFEMRLQKYSCFQIAIALNQDRIPAPHVYRIEKKGKELRSGKDTNWSDCSVKVILENRVYCGDVINNKSTKKNFKSQKRNFTDESEWLIAYDMHEPIVSRKDWERCAEIARQANSTRVRTTKQRIPKLFAGLLKCPDCGYSITSVNNYGYNCGNYQKKGKMSCASHHISSKVLEELVLADIREKVGEILLDEESAKARYYTLKEQSGQSQLNHNKKSLAKINKRLIELERLMQAAFERSVLHEQGIDIFTRYLAKYESEKTELIHQVNTLTAAIDKQSQTEHGVNSFISLLKKYANITKLDRQMVVELIDKITISDLQTSPRSIVIYYNFVGCVGGCGEGGGSSDVK